MNRRGRRWAAIATVTVVLATGTGVARAYFAPGAGSIAKPAGYFTFCADRQRDIAGITQDDLDGVPDAASATPLSFSIENYVHSGPGPLAGSDLPSAPPVHPFVAGKSGIRFTGTGASDIRRVMTTQWVEYADAERTIPVQVRCKMRTAESLLRPPDQMQRLDDNVTNSSVPWGFGPSSATGPVKSCREVQQSIVAGVWAAMSDPERSGARFKYGTSDVVFGSESLSISGSQWTLGQKIVKVESGVLTIADRSLTALSTDASAPSDRLRGAAYCTFVAPDYIRSVMLTGNVV